MGASWQEMQLMIWECGDLEAHISIRVSASLVVHNLPTTFHVGLKWLRLCPVGMEQLRPTMVGCWPTEKNSVISCIDRINHFLTKHGRDDSST